MLSASSSFLSSAGRRLAGRGVQLLPSTVAAATNSIIGATRNLMVHEQVSMDLMKSFNIKTPTCYTATTAAEAENIYRTLLNPPGSTSAEAIIKAQVLCGGRGKGTFLSGLKGGVHLVKSPDHVRDIAAQMLGSKLVTHQAPKGVICNKVLLRECFDLHSELYLSITMDRKSQGPVIVASPCGGTEIEVVAKTKPELIFTEVVDIEEGVTDEQCFRIATSLGFQPGSKPHTQAIELTRNLYTMFIKCECTQIEINPLALTDGDNLVVCDSKINFDSRSSYRQKEIFKHRDSTQEDPREVFAKKHGFNYVGLEGSVGCMVNGAGLAMSTMDLISIKGGEPACFLDVGGSADETQIQAAFQVLDEDPRVKAILVNIFGGIVRCDMIGAGIVEAVRKSGTNKPIVIRLEGTNAEKGRQVIADSGLPNTIPENNWEKATNRVLKLAAAQVDVGQESEAMQSMTA